MWEIPSKVIVSNGTGVAATSITAFDKALMKAGVCNLNLVRVTSVLPPGAAVIKLNEIERPLRIPPGSLVPAVYSHLTSATIGAVISSAVAVGIPGSVAESGMIFATSVTGEASIACDLVEQMVVEALDARGSKIARIVIDSSELTIEDQTGCSVVIAILL